MSRKNFLLGVACVAIVSASMTQFAAANGAFARHLRSGSGDGSQPHQPLLAIPDEIVNREYARLGLIVMFQSKVPPTISDVMQGSPAQVNGIMAGDKLITVNGQPMLGLYSEPLQDNSMDLNVRLLRGNQIVKVVLPAQNAADFGYFSAAGIGVLGSANGLKVVASKDNSALQVGDLITSAMQQNIRTPADLVDVAQKAQTSITVTATAGNRTKFVSLQAENLRAMVGSAVAFDESFGVSLENLFDFYAINVNAGSKAEQLGFQSGDRIIRLNNKTPRQITDTGAEFASFQSARVRRKGQVLLINTSGVQVVGGSMSFQVANLTNKPVNLVYRNSASGQVQETIYQTVQPNQIATQKASFNQKWVLRDAYSGQALKEFSPTVMGQGVIVGDAGSLIVFSGLGVSGKFLSNRNFVVGLVEDNSQAAGLGLQMGDQIVSINDIPANSIGDDSDLTSEEFTMNVLFHGMGPMQRVGTASEMPDTTPLIAGVPAPDWVKSAKPGVPGGITVTTPDADNPPAIADIATFYIKERTKEPLALVRVHYHGTQVVAGSKQYLVCEMGNRQTGQLSYWNVEIYIEPGQQLPQSDNVTTTKLN
jgi:PDZ domain